MKPQWLRNLLCRAFGHRWAVYGGGAIFVPRHDICVRCMVRRAIEERT